MFSLFLLLRQLLRRQRSYWVTQGVNQADVLRATNSRLGTTEQDACFLNRHSSGKALQLQLRHACLSGVPWNLFRLHSAAQSAESKTHTF